MPLLLDIAIALKRKFELHASHHASYIHQEAMNKINSTNGPLPCAYPFTPFLGANTTVHKAKTKKTNITKRHSPSPTGPLLLYRLYLCT